MIHYPEAGKGRLALAAGITFLMLLAVLMAVGPGFFNRATETIPSAEKVSGMLAEIRSNPSRIPTTDEFVIPKKFHRNVLAFFDGKSRKWETNIRNKIELDKYMLGKIFFKIQNDNQLLEVSFYEIGQGGIGYSIGNHYYLIDFKNNCGAMSLLYILDEARKEVGIKTPPPYPPPIKTDDNIFSLTVSIAHRGRDEPEMIGYSIPPGDIPTIMRWLRGRVQATPEAPPEALRLGTLSLTLKDGKLVTVRYYQAPPGEISFSINGVHYRSHPLEYSMDSKSLHQDVLFIINSDKTIG